MRCSEDEMQNLKVITLQSLTMMRTRSSHIFTTGFALCKKMFKMYELEALLFDNRKFIAFKIGGSQKAVNYHFKNNKL